MTVSYNFFPIDTALLDMQHSCNVYPRTNLFCNISNEPDQEHTYRRKLPVYVGGDVDAYSVDIFAPFVFWLIVTGLLSTTGITSPTYCKFSILFVRFTRGFTTVGVVDVSF